MKNVQSNFIREKMSEYAIVKRDFAILGIIILILAIAAYLYFVQPPLKSSGTPEPTRVPDNQSRNEAPTVPVKPEPARPGGGAPPPKR